MKKYFGTDGIRGIANIDLTNDTAYIVTRAAIEVLIPKEKYKNEKPRVLIGKDTRISSDMLESGIISGILSMGCDAHRLGVVPTPATAYLAQDDAFDLAIMLSASHNSYEYNGLKIFHKGKKLTDDLETEIEKYIIDEKQIKRVISHDKIGVIVDESKLVDKYIKSLHNDFKKNLNLKGKSLIMDTANGSNYAIASKVFKLFGATVDSINNEPNGININDNCGAVHPDTLSKVMKKKENKGKFHLGIVFDGDGDRFIAVDDKGEPINGDIVMGLSAMYLNAIGIIDKKVAVTIMSNIGYIRFMEKKGFEVLQTKVGDKYVSEMLEEQNINFGGEQSGHIIFNKTKYTGDAIQSALILLSALEYFKKPLSELKKQIKILPQVLVNVIIDKNKKQDFLTVNMNNKTIEKIEKEIEKAKGRLLIRPSGTEPLIRVMIEGEDIDKITEWANEIANIYAKQLK